MKKLFKKLLTFSATIPLALVVSCSHNLNDYSTKDKQLESLKSVVDYKDKSVNEKWDLFLQRPHINAILNAVFKDKESKDKYIKSQKALGEEYFKEIKDALRYANNIVFPYDKGESYFDFKTFKYISTKNYLVSSGSETLKTLYNENWLFFLFHLDRFVFIQFPDVATDILENKEIIDEIESNKKVFNDFYNPESNEIIDFVIQRYSYEKSDDYDDEDEKDPNKVDEYLYQDRIFMLTKDGRILWFQVAGNETLNTISTSLKPNLHSWLYSYPKLIKSPDKLAEFDLKKYIEIAREWGDPNYRRASVTRKTIFADEYGKKEFRYTLVNVKE
ncbi:aromatic motif membrane protein [Mycoplasmopsis edwardii]|uniref:Uncharacterized protein n=1 Tax=Mycoplasmopsis edwardii TaxID=53558 RepID=A0ACD4PI85_9BACT|nr:aromatic motif membrane protein [Mycoplasmopsis edwardii]WBP84320.1 hypothetical protein Me_995_000300 [Mycoplasmopsis edwardii]